MARKEIPATVEIIDDLTGKTVTDAKSAKVTLDGKPYTLDLSAETLAAFAAFLAAPSDENRRAFGALIPRPKVGTTRAAGNGADKRAWLRSNGYPALAERGKFTDEMNAAWDKFNAEPASA
jgi:hypothetical protein